MAGLQTGPNTFFCVGPAETGKAQCFAVKRGEVVGRAEVAFHQPWIRDRIATLETSRYVVNKMRTAISEVRYGVGSPPQYLEKGENTVPFVRATSIKDGEIDPTTLLYVAAEQPNHMDKCKLAGGELIIVRSGVNTGDCAVVPKSLANAYAAYDLILTFQSGISAKFVATFLDSEVGRLQLNLVKGRSAQPHINAEEVGAILIPLPPVLDQERLVAAMDTARAERKAKLAKADELLAGLDDFVLDALGLARPEQDSRRVFAIRRGDMTGFQLSPSRYKPELQAFLNRLRSHPAVSQPLGEYVDINPEVDLSGVDEQKTVGFIPMKAVSDGATGDYVLEERPLAEVRKGYTPFEEGDILWAKITPCMQNGKSCIVEGLPNGIGFGSTEFHVLRVREQGIVAEFVKEFVSQQKLRQVATYVFTGSAGQQRVPAEFLANLPFPKLPESRQMEIVEEVAETRARARRLRAEAEAGWKEAKRWFEEQLLESD